MEKIKNYLLRFGINLSNKEIWFILTMLVSLVVFMIALLNNVDFGAPESTLKSNL